MAKGLFLIRDGDKYFAGRSTDKVYWLEGEHNAVLWKDEKAARRVWRKELKKRGNVEGTKNVRSKK